MKATTLIKRFPIGRRVRLAQWGGTEWAYAVVVANDGRCVDVRVEGTYIGTYIIGVHISVAHRDLRVIRLR